MTTETKAQHTPTPWRINFSRVEEMPVDFHITGNEHGSSFPILVCGSIKRVAPASEIEANAEFVVKAVNSHADLVAALESLLEEIGKISPSDEAIEMAEKALSKARNGGV